MKYLAALLLLISTVSAHAGFAGFLTKETRDWSFIQTVGGMKVTLEDRTLHVDCDVSGTRKVTVKPTMINSGMAVREVKHKQVGKTIELRLVTSVLEKGLTTTPKPLDLSGYPAGKYTVVYRDRDGATHPLGSLVLK